jgi:hypothetical protein
LEHVVRMVQTGISEKIERIQEVGEKVEDNG